MERLLTDPSTMTVIYLALLVVLLVFSAGFSSTETALFCLNRIQRQQLAQDKSKRAQLIVESLKRPRALLSTILFGNTFVNISTSAVAALLFSHLMVDHNLTAAIVVDSLLVLFLGEIIPKSVAVSQAKPMSLTAIVPLDLFAKAFRPLVTIYDRVAALILAALGVPEEARSALSPSELEVLFDEADRVDTITSHESRIARNIVRFSETTAEEIMTPRIDVVAAPLDMPRPDMEELMTTARHTRIPLCEGSLDHVVGFASTKEFLLNPDRSVKELLKPVAIFPEGARTHRIFRHMQKNLKQMAVIVDEYGVTSGIVTMEDLVEEIVGEIYDEYDEKGDEFFRSVGPNEWIVKARAPIEKVNEICGLTLPEDEAVTLNGYLCEAFGEIPSRGRTLEKEGALFTIVEAKRGRIVQCRVKGIKEMERP